MVTLLEVGLQAFAVVAVEVHWEPELPLEQLGALPKAVHQEDCPPDTLPLMRPAENHSPKFMCICVTAELASWI